MNNNKINICGWIVQKLKEEKRSVAWLAKKIYMDPSNLRKRLKKQSLDTALLQRISKVLNFWFFQYYNEDNEDVIMKE